MNLNLIEAIEQLEEEKGIPKEDVIVALEQALKTAYKSNFGGVRNVEVEIDRMTGDVKIYQLLTVCEEPKDPNFEISLEEALKIDSKAEVGATIKKPLNLKDFRRIAVQTARQVLIQKIRTFEKENIFKKYSEMVGSVTTAEVMRVTDRLAYVRIGKIETAMHRRDWIRGEELKPGTLIKVYIVKVEKIGKTPRITISRSIPEFLVGLMKLEVPEIEQGVVEVKKVVRESGLRSKVAVLSHDPNVDPVGACIGEGGSRINSVLKEIKPEKVDIIKWSDDPAELIANALAPAKVADVRIIDDRTKTARVLVAPSELSVAIGKGGQNARLAAKLTGWKIDIKSIM